MANFMLEYSVGSRLPAHFPLPAGRTEYVAFRQSGGERRPETDDLRHDEPEVLLFIHNLAEAE